MPNPTVVAASLDDQQLRTSIDALVKHVDDSFKRMVNITNTTVSEMQSKLQTLKNVDLGGASSSSSTRTTSIKKEVEARKELTTTLDQNVQALNRAQGRSDVLAQYDQQIENLKRRLVEVRGDIDVFNYAIGSGKATQISWGQEGLKQANAEAERLMTTILTLEKQRANLANVLNPGESFKNYVNSIGKRSSEIEALNKQIKEGSLLRQQSTKATKEDEEAMRQRVQREQEFARQNIAMESQRRAEILRTAQTAQEAANRIIRSMYEQASNVNSTAPITGAKELAAALQQMRHAYFNVLSPSERTSPIGKALEEDIKRAEKAYQVILKYNSSLLNLGNQNNHQITETSTLTSLRSSLKLLADQYSKLTVAELNAGKGDQLIQKYQNINRAAQLLQNTLSRPVNFAAVQGLQERNLDDIAYKIKQLQSYRAGLNLEKERNEINQVNQELNRLKQKQNEILQSNESLKNSNNALTRSWNYMKNRLAFYFTVGASTAFVKNLIDVRSQYEMNERALGILINSAERGTQIFNELSQMALVSPYTLIELSTAAKQLTAYDVAARDVVDTTRRLADMAAAVGIPIERLTYALGQIKAYGYLNSRDARMFSNAGIPLVKQLADYYTELEGKLVSTADVYDRIKKKAIGYTDVMQVVNRMTDEGGKFFDFQSKMADTLKVRLANLTLAWNNMLNDIGAETQGLLTWGIGAFKELFLHWRQFDSMIKSASWAGLLVVAMRALNVLLVKAGFGFRILSTEMTTAGIAGSKVANVLSTIGSATKRVLSSSLFWWSLLAFAIVDATRTIMNLDEAQKALNKSIRDGAKDNYENIAQYLEQYQNIRDSLYKKTEYSFTDGTNTERKRAYETPQDIDPTEAGKVWETMREQIELVTSASNDYIGRLLQIENVSERLRQGFSILDNIQQVSAALKEVGDDTFKVAGNASAWWNLWTLQDGLVDNIKDYRKAVDNVTKSWGDMRSAIDSSNEAAAEDIAKVNTAAIRLENDVNELTDSIIAFITLKGWNADENKINEVFAQVVNKIANENNLNPQEAFDLQLSVEEARAKAAKQALRVRLQDEIAALKVSNDEQIAAAYARDTEIYNNWEKYNGKSRVYWNDFTKWMKEQHIHEMTAMFRNMDAEDIRSLDFQQGKYYDWVNNLVTKYAKEHHMAYQDVFNTLRHYVTSANQWSIFIPLTISTGEHKSVFATLSEADAQADKAVKTIRRLERRQKELEEKGVGATADKKTQQEYTAILTEKAAAQKDYNDAIEKGGHSQKEETEAKKASNKAAREGAKAQREAESELQRALKDELSLIDKVRSQYKKLTDAGVGSNTALTMVTKQFDKSISHINTVLGKNGLPLFDLTTFAGTDNPNKLLQLLKAQLEAAKSAPNIKPSEIKDLEVKYSEIVVDAKVYNAKKIADGLNNELGKLKDEYELALELDAHPELGELFADMWGINTETLPHTVKEYADDYVKLVNKYLKDNNAGLRLPTLDLTDDDLRAFEEMTKNEAFNEEWYKVIETGVKAIRAARKKDYEETSKEWDKLIEKYGGLQAKILKIAKDTTNEQIGIIRKFGEDEDVKQALQLQAQINLSDDPEQIASLSEQLEAIRAKLSAKNPKALNLFDATTKEQKSKTSKAYWDDFKDSELYSMTFEDMQNVSTRAIRAIIGQLDSLKDKVKEDPASMKALIKSLEDAEKELITRNPFGNLVSSYKEWRDAVKDVKTAKQQLRVADNAVVAAERNLKDAQDAGDVVAIDKATKDLADSRKKQGEATLKVTKTENAAIKAQKKFADTCQSGADMLNNFSSIIEQFVDLLGVAEDSDADVAIKSITKALGVMAAALGFAASMAMVLNSTMPYLAAIAAVLGVITAAFSFLSGQRDARITRQIKESERAVKRLENTYKNLTDVVENAYGAMVSGAQKAVQANKELQLVELQRQLALEKSRSKKKRDEDKIIDLEGQIIELRNEIKNATQDVINDMLGISSAGDGIESLVQAMIDAFRNGEDAMKAFGDKWDEMIDNMMLKLIVSHYMQKAWDKIMSDLSSMEDTMLKRYSEENAKAQQEYDRLASMTDNDIAAEIARQQGKYIEYKFGAWRPSSEMIAAYRAAAENALRASTETLNDASYDYTQWSLDYMSHEGRDYMMQYAQLLKDSLGNWYTYGENSEKSLSALQQGITGITEDTAGALEAYMNGVSQQVYLHSDLLTQIRDAVVGFDGDVQLATLSQVLLQLQSSYTVQMSIQSILEGWNNPSGRAVRVELIS